MKKQIGKQKCWEKNQTNQKGGGLFCKAGVQWYERRRGYSKET